MPNGENNFKTSYFRYKKETLSFDELKAKGNSSYRKQEFEKALGFYNRALKLVNGSSDEAPAINLNKAQVLLKLDRFEDAYIVAKLALDSGIVNEAKAHYRSPKVAYKC